MIPKILTSTFFVLLTIYFPGYQTKSGNAKEKEIVADRGKPVMNPSYDNWQLFVDDYWIADSKGVITTLHQPEKYPVNPLIRGDEPWEKNPYCFGSVIYDDSIFKIWYMTYNYDMSLKERTFILYAESSDGIHWTRPDLGLYEFQGSKNNNIVLTNYGYHDLYSPCVIKDTLDSDPSRRYKMIWWDFPLGDQEYRDDGMCVAFSPDGIHWAKYSGNPVLHANKSEHSISDVMSVMQDRRTGKYIAYTKGWADPWPAFRQIVRTESTDFINWSVPQVVITHKHDMQDPQSYGMSVTQSGNLFMGLLHSYKNPGDETIDVQLTVSHDSRHWTRVAGQSTFIPTGPAGSWDSGMIFTAPIINHGYKTMIYYGGWNGAHNESNRHSGIGLAVVRKNGFVSLDAGADGGSVRTYALKNAKGHLYVNADVAGGLLRAEVLDAKGIPIPGYTIKDCIPAGSYGIEQMISWRKHDILPVTDKNMRIHFEFKNASLYGFYAGPEVERDKL